MERELDTRLFIRHVVVINLERRKDRLERFMVRWNALIERYDELRSDEKHPAHAERREWPDLELTILHGFDGAERAAHMGRMAGRYGCYRSHLEALRQSPSGPTVPLLILEDDAIFEPFMERLQGMAIPSNWEILWLGGEHRLVPEHVLNDGEPTGLVRVRSMQRSHAYVVRSPNVVYRHMAPLTGVHDRLMSRLPIAQYALWPGLAGQEAGMSDISAMERPEPMFWNNVTPTGGPLSGLPEVDPLGFTPPDFDELNRQAAAARATEEAGTA